MKLLPLIALVLLIGCVTPRPQTDNVADAILVTSADIESAAQTVKTLCGNLEPGGPCMPGAAISTETKESLKIRLQEAQNAVVLADRLLENGLPIDAASKLALAESIIIILQAELARRAQ
jgi:hypothetical protein